MCIKETTLIYVEFDMLWFQASTEELGLGPLLIKR